MVARRSGWGQGHRALLIKESGVPRDNPPQLACRYSIAEASLEKRLTGTMLYPNTSQQARRLSGRHPTEAMSLESAPRSRQEKMELKTVPRMP